MNAAVRCFRNCSGLKVEEQAGGGLEEADAAGVARNCCVRYLRERREARKEGCIGDLAWVRRHPSEEVGEQGVLGFVGCSGATWMGSPGGLLPCPFSSA